MKAVILSAGIGARMGELTREKSKVMLPINGIPLLHRQIEYLRSFGITQFYINVHYLAETITGYFKNGKKLGVDITYAYEPVLAGTGGALNLFKSQLNESTILIYGDVFTNIDINSFKKFHRTRKSILSAVIRDTDHPFDSDLVEINNTRRITKLFNKPHKTLPATKFGLSAIYMFEPEIIKYLPDKIPFDLAQDFIPILLKKGIPVYGYETQELIMDIGTPQRYEKVNKQSIL